MWDPGPASSVLTNPSCRRSLTMDFLAASLNDASTFVSKTVQDVKEVNIQDEASTVFSRAKQVLNCSARETTSQHVVLWRRLLFPSCDIEQKKNSVPALCIKLGPALESLVLMQLLRSSETVSGRQFNKYGSIQELCSTFTQFY